MREALVPRARDAELLGAVFGRMPGEWVEVAGGEFGSVEVGGEGSGGVGGDAVLDPDLGGAVVLPVGEEADAVAACEDVIEVMLEVSEGEVFVDGLGDLEGGLDIEGDSGKDTESSEMNDGSRKDVGVFGARDGVDGPVVGDDLEGGNGGGEVSVGGAGAVGGGGAGSDDGDVGQGGEVVEGKAAGIDVGSELAVGDSGADGDGFGVGVKGDGVEGFERDLVLGAVGDGVEGVAGSEGAELDAGFDDL